MLLIACPYCGMERPEIEFAYGGEAHIARPADPSALSDAGMGALPLLPLQSERASSPSAGAMRSAAGVSSIACATR